MIGRGQNAIDLCFKIRYDNIQTYVCKRRTKMRKIKILLLSLLLAFCMAGCSEGSSVAISGSGDETAGKISQNGSGMEVHFIDVGQGDSTLIKVGGHAMLIDAGDNSCGTLVRNYLKKAEVESIDYVVCTHPDEDHIGGMASVIENVPINSQTIWMPNIKKDTKTYDNLIREAERNYINISMPEIGKEYHIGKASFMVIGPLSNHKDDNSNSLVIKLWYGDISFLFTGDCEEEEEQEILSSSYADILSSTVLKVGHHGSQTSSCEEFIKTVVCLICGELNESNAPTVILIRKF